MASNLIANIAKKVECLLRWNPFNSSLFRSIPGPHSHAPCTFHRRGFGKDSMTK